jgi:hypothetical protein
MIGPNGLLWGFDWLADGPWWVVLLKCWALTPLMMFLVIAPIFESRWLSLSFKKQYLSFFPGDFFLGIMVTLLVVSARQVQVDDLWYEAVWVHFLLLALTMCVAVWLTRGEVKNGFYPKRAMLSPTKIYHNGVLYAGYGYVAVMLLMQAVTHLTVSGLGWPAFIGALAALAVWGVLLIPDNRLTPEDRKLKSENAHIADWRPLWYWII